MCYPQDPAVVKDILGRDIPFTIVGGPNHGGRIYIPLAALDGKPVHAPVFNLGDDGTVQVVQIAAYSPEVDTRRAIYQIEKTQ